VIETTYGARFVAELQRISGIRGVHDAATIEHLRRCGRTETIEAIRWDLHQGRLRLLRALEPEALAREVHAARVAALTAKPTPILPRLDARRAGA